MAKKNDLSHSPVTTARMTRITMKRKIMIGSMYSYSVFRKAMAAWWMISPMSYMVLLPTEAFMTLEA